MALVQEMLNDFLTLVEQAGTPAVPAAGDQLVYFKTDHKLYHENHAGEETEVAGGSAAAFVGARYATNAGNTVAVSVAVVDFEDQTYDSGTLVTTGASWHFTAPSTGYYHVSLCLTLGSASWSAANDFSAYLYVNGSSYSQIGSLQGIAGTLYARLMCSDTVYLTTGQSLDVRASQNAQTTIALYNNDEFNHVAIHKIG